jgi:Na+/H+-dicarboxylate symporter
MSKLLAILGTLKAILIAASVAFARGDMLPVILISILLNLTQLGAKPIGQAVLRDPVASPPSQDRNR